MKKPFDFLFTDKIPFLVFSKSKIMMKDGMLCVLNKEGIKTISPANLGMILLDVGISITHDAINELSKHGCLICFSNGGINIHSIFLENRQLEPEGLMNQVYLVKNKKLEIAKELFKIRLDLIKQKTLVVEIDLDLEKAFEKIEETTTIEQLLGKEGFFHRSLYKKYATKYKIDDFKRNFEYKTKTEENFKFSSVNVNERLNKLHSTLYSFVSSVCLSANLLPSLAFIHGKKRRGGLAFDLADIIKNVITSDLCFDKNYEDKKLYFYLKNRLVENNYFYTKLLFFICKQISEGKINLYELCKKEKFI